MGTKDKVFNLSPFYHPYAGIYHLPACCEFLPRHQSTDNRPTPWPNRPIKGLNTMRVNLPPIHRRADGIYRSFE